MSQLLATPQVAIALAACVLAMLIAGGLVLNWGGGRLPADRRRPDVVPSAGVLARAATTAIAVVDKMLRRRGADAGAGLAALEQAGIKMRFQDFAFLVMVGTLAACALGLLFEGPILALLLAAAVPLGAKLAVGQLSSRRRSKFADQLDDSLQLLAGSLRAGHSLLQAMASVSREAEEPTSVEFSRVINETRVGRELSASLDETARRMESEDFVWVIQAIAINREVGGNLAEVLDGVGQTIRERNQIRRQVKALSAEGKLSAYILMALPFGITGFLSITNSGYMSKFTESLTGYALIAASVVLLILGGLWLRKIVSFKF